MIDDDDHHNDEIFISFLYEVGRRRRDENNLCICPMKRKDKRRKGKKKGLLEVFPFRIPGAGFVCAWVRSKIISQSDYGAKSPNSILCTSLQLHPCHALGDSHGVRVKQVRMTRFHSRCGLGKEVLEWRRTTILTR